MTIELQDKLYTSTQVADVLGVSLRTLYRYMEDGRIKSMRTASGRHRFTKDQIVDFLNAGNFDEFAPGSTSEAGYQPYNPGRQENEFIGRANLETPNRYESNINPESGNSFYRPPVNQNREYEAPRPPVSQTPAQHYPETNFDRNLGDRNLGIKPHDDMLDNPTPIRQSVVGNDSFYAPKPSADVFSSIDDFDFNAVRENKTVIENEFKQEKELDSFDPFEFRESELRNPQTVPSDPREFDKPNENAQGYGYSKSFEYGREREVSYEPSVRPQAYTPPVPQYTAPVAAAPSYANEYVSNKQGATDSLTNRPEDKEIFDLSYPSLNIRYYKSDFSDLIDLARKIKDTGRSRDLEYAFTLFAGLSLHFLIKPFTVLHFYANPEDMQIWKEDLRLTPANRREDANIGIIVNTDIVFVPTKEIAGFKVSEDKVLLRDLADAKEEDLVKQFRQHLMSR